MIMHVVPENAEVSSCGLRNISRVAETRLQVIVTAQLLHGSSLGEFIKIYIIIGASLSETHMMRSTGILSVCQSCCLFVRTSTFRIYSCSNSTITHAQNLCAKFSSHVVCTCSY